MGEKGKLMELGDKQTSNVFILNVNTVSEGVLID